MAKRGADVSLLFHSFMYEVSKATASLLYLLQGMEAVRKRELGDYESRSPKGRQFAACFAKLTYIDVPLCLSGPSFDLDDVLKREGEAEQLAFKGWVDQVYNGIWDRKYRKRLRATVEGSRSIRPEVDPIGDLRRIRIDLVHKGGVATEENIGKCKVLKWFVPGQPIVLGTRHLFDFLNQMAFMTRTPGYLDNGPNSKWTVFPGMEQHLVQTAIPKLVSLRTSFDKELADGSTSFVFSVVFENGVFVNIPFDCPPDDRPLDGKIAWVGKTCIDSAGDLRFPDGSAKDRASLYREAVDALCGKRPTKEGRGVPGPAFRIRK